MLLRTTLLVAVLLTTWASGCVEPVLGSREPHQASRAQWRSNWSSQRGQSRFPRADASQPIVHPGFPSPAASPVVAPTEPSSSGRGEPTEPPAYDPVTQEPSTSAPPTESPPTTDPTSVAPSESPPATTEPPSNEADPPTNATVRFLHPGLLHTAEDLLRIKQKVAEGLEPWTSAYAKLTASKHASINWIPSPVPIVYRGATAGGNYSENYGKLYRDTASAYQLALRWHISGNDSFADHAVLILNSWAATLQSIEGSSDRYLASGLYGYQLANAAELLRGYSGWSATEFSALVDMLLRVFYPMNHNFLVNHNGRSIDHYWANWDLANVLTMLSVGILADREDIYNEAITYFKHGEGNGAIEKAVWIVYPDGTGQVQESGRDQAHATLVSGLLGSISQTAYNQQEDLFAYLDNRVLAGTEYVAKYNLGYDVNYTTYTNSEVNQTVVSDVRRGEPCPLWELLYNHYVVLKNLSAPYISEWASKMRPDGGGGNYGPNSGGYDMLGFGTLVYSR